MGRDDAAEESMRPEGDAWRGAMDEASELRGEQRGMRICFQRDFFFSLAGFFSLSIENAAMVSRLKKFHGNEFEASFFKG